MVVTVPLFQRAQRRKNTSDEAGSVSVTVVLLDERDHKHKRGNITRSFLIQDTRVSHVAAVLEGVFGKQGEP